MNESLCERKGLLVIAITVFAIALATRLGGDGRVPPYDDAYHLKRIEFSAANFPQTLSFDPDRGENGAFCPWPPLYDVAMAPLHRVVTFVPPIFFALFAAGVAAAMLRFGALPALTAGLTLALSPYLIGISRRGHIDHHYVEPLLLLAIVAACSLRRYVLLGVLITVALFVQTAMLVAAGLAFVAIFTSPQSSVLGPRVRSVAFLIPAIAVLLYRLAQPAGYPTSPWLLGYPHAALLLGAAIALLPHRLALPAGIAVALSFPSTLVAGLGFFRGDPWLSSIVEFQPMFSHAYQFGTDIANLTGGAILGLLLWRKQRAFTIFLAPYLLLALSSRRFLVPAIALFAIGGALATAYARRRTFAWAAALLTIVPPIAYDIYTLRQPDVSDDAYFAIAQRMDALQSGRVLAPWSFGHAIDVFGHKPVVVDNFGSMPDPRVFRDAIEAMLSTRISGLLGYCHERRIRYLVLPHPAYIPATAATIGIDPELYSRTRLARHTVWSRLYGGERIAGFELVSGGAISIWKID